MSEQVEKQMLPGENSKKTMVKVAIRDEKGELVRDEHGNPTYKYIEKVSGGRPGRPIDPNSERQKKLAAKGGSTGKGERGRPINPDSERQKKLAALAERRKQLGVQEGEKLSQGRPINPDSERQKKLARQARENSRTID